MIYYKYIKNLTNLEEREMALRVMLKEQQTRLKYQRNLQYRLLQCRRKDLKNIVYKKKKDSAFNIINDFVVKNNNNNVKYNEKFNRVQQKRETGKMMIVDQNKIIHNNNNNNNNNIINKQSLEYCVYEYLMSRNFNTLAQSFVNLTNRRKHLEVQNASKMRNYYNKTKLDHIYNLAQQQQMNKNKKSQVIVIVPNKIATNQMKLQKKAVKQEKSQKDTTSRIKCTWKGCTKTFTKHTNMRRHYKLHQGIKPFKCEHQITGETKICGKTFARRADLRAHVRTHTGEKPYSCGYCSRKFARNSDMRSHERTIHIMRQK